jgi:amino acid transporter
VLVPILAVGLIGVAYLVNMAGNKVIEATANTTAAIKILGLIALAIAGLSTGVIQTLEGPAQSAQAPEYSIFIAALALSILAYNGFTTITNQGNDIVDPTRNVGRSIILSLLICAALYFALALAVAGNLPVPEVIAAKDYSLAQAARPVFGDKGLWFTVIIAIVATVSGVFASVYSASRMLGMLIMMKQVPQLGKRAKNPALLFTVLLAITLTILFDLTRIAAIGAIFYLVMDIAIHWGLVRHLRGTLSFNPIIPLIAIVLDTVILVAFVLLKYQSDPLVPATAAVGIVLVIAGEKLFMKSHTDSDGNMDMDSTM